jgi:hypothetical protein
MLVVELGPGDRVVHLDRREERPVRPLDLEYADDARSSSRASIRLFTPEPSQVFTGPRAFAAETVVVIHGEGVGLMVQCHSNN